MRIAIEKRLQTLSPVCWNPFTWIFIATYLGLFVWGNFPLWHQHPKENPTFDLRSYSVNSRDKANEIHYEFTGISGWPIGSTKTIYPSQKISQVRTFIFVANLLVFLVGTACIVMIGERFFSSSFAEIDLS